MELLVPENDVFASPREVEKVNDCYFYHTSEIPGYGIVHGEWDLRNRESEYLGNFDFNGKRVLELGTASGHLAFFMEAHGAEVVAYDLSEHQSWDLVPYGGAVSHERCAIVKTHIQKLNNGFWFIHNKRHSQTKVAYGSIYAVPEEIGMFDVCVFGSILLHLRDPFLALQNTLKLSKRTVVITDLLPRLYFLKKVLFFPFVFFPQRWQSLCKPTMAFLPHLRSTDDMGWWILSPEILVAFVKILGFTDCQITYHRQFYHGKLRGLYTLVAHRV
jgi:hypothetical protein